MSAVFFRFIAQMSAELKANEGKGDFEKKTEADTLLLLDEIRWHEAKLSFAIKARNRKEILEFTADCANILMMIAIAYKALEEKPPEPTKEVRCPSYFGTSHEGLDY